MFGRAQRSDGWTDDNTLGPGNGWGSRPPPDSRNQATLTTASHLFWQSHAQSERDYLAANTVEEAHAALYNQQDSWTMHIFVGDALAHRRDEECLQYGDQLTDDRNSARDHDHQVGARYHQQLRASDRRDRNRQNPIVAIWDQGAAQHARTGDYEDETGSADDPEAAPNP